MKIKKIKFFRGSKRFAVAGAALLLSVFCLRAETIYKLTFDDDGPEGGMANNPYTPAKGDVIPDRVQIARLDPKSGEIPQIVKSTGPQGGKSLSLHKPAEGVAGYLAEGGGSFTFKGKSGATWEAVFYVDSYHSGLAGLVSSFGTGGISPALRLTDDAHGDRHINNPLLEFGPGLAKLDDENNQKSRIVYAPPQSLVGEWHHAAGVYTCEANAKGQGKVELFLDGTSVAVSFFEDADFQKELFIIGGYSFGVDAPRVDPLRVLEGQLDAIAISDEALDPKTFVLPWKIVKKTQRKREGFPTVQRILCDPVSFLRFYASSCFQIRSSL